LVQEFISTENIPIEQINKGEFIHTEEGNIKVRITADIIQRYKDIQPTLLFSDNISVIFYNRDLEVISELNSEKATIDENKKIMTALNNVILQGSDKRLETQQLTWDEKTDKIYTKKKVKIITNKEVIFGEGFTSNIDFSVFSIDKINGTFNLDIEK
tara:strand:- start:32 stop:502 length:471 start_codon:yes stop_codon:yes gene_type:complete